MAGNTYVVRLVDCLKGIGGVEKDAAGILANLKTWYAQVCQAASGSGTTWSADVQWMDYAPMALPGSDPGNSLVVNLILFYVPSTRHSMIELHPAWDARQSVDAFTSDLGLTFVSALTNGADKVAISEIYVSRCRNTSSSTADSVLNMSRIGFHEGMHNQLFMGQGLHRRGTGFRAEAPTGSSPDATNLKDMSGVLGTLIPQWPDGISLWRAKYQV
jgi:hypothetical protein